MAKRIWTTIQVTPEVRAAVRLLASYRQALMSDVIWDLVQPYIPPGWPHSVPAKMFEQVVEPSERKDTSDVPAR